ncbi:MAG: hypothetical protein KBT03_13145 [Bacteroidales bacterium]|nr:hypothetical protein [Candidatus Scybalousia scybalohippi]
MEIKITVKGVYYHLRPYKEFRNEWDLSVDGKMICDSRGFHSCLQVMLERMKDTPEELEEFILKVYG